MGDAGLEAESSIMASGYDVDVGATVTLHNAEESNTDTELYWGSGNPLWNNDVDTAFLYDNEGNFVDSLKG